MANNSFVILFILSFALLSCTTKLKPSDYKAWLEDSKNGVVKENTVSSLKIKAYYRPTAYMALNELGVETYSSDSVFKNIQQEYSGTQYYELVISMDSTDFIKEQSSDKNDYLNNLYYYTFNFKDAISLTYNDSLSLPVSLYHFERAYGLTHSKKFLIGFENKEMMGSRSIKIDSPLLPTGVVNLFFDKKNIDQASAIEIIL